MDSFDARLSVNLVISIALQMSVSTNIRSKGWKLLIITEVETVISNSAALFLERRHD